METRISEGMRMTVVAVNECYDCGEGASHEINWTKTSTGEVSSCYACPDCVGMLIVAYTKHSKVATVTMAETKLVEVLV